jgi:hypothetical protein
MSQNVKCYPPKDFMIAFLATRNVRVVDDKENVLHYFGKSYRELRNIANSDKPDLVIIHNPEFICDEKDLQRFNYVVDYVSNNNEIYTTKTIKTNNFKLCQIYYRKLGLQRNIDIFYKKPEEKPSNKLDSYRKKIFEFMKWA